MRALCSRTGKSRQDRYPREGPERDDQPGNLGHRPAYGRPQNLPDSDEQESSTYMLDGLLEAGRKVLVNAGDDAHFGHPRDRFGGWVEVYCEYRDPEALLNSMKVGRYYSTQGPSLRELVVDGKRLRVRTSEAYTISLSGAGGRRHRATRRSASADGEPILEAEFALTPFRGSYCRLTVVDLSGRQAWSNPIWP